MPTAAEDVTALTQLLGRPPRAAFDVVVRRPTGEPVVIRNAPLLDDGTPMPTRYWLVDRKLHARVARLESAGGVRAAEHAVDADELQRAHDRYATERDAAMPPAHVGPQPALPIVLCQRAMHDQIGITPNRTGEMQVVRLRQSIMTKRLRKVARAFQTF